MEIMALSDTEQEQFFNKVVKINFDDTETEYGVAVDCDQVQWFFEIYLIKVLDGEDQEIHHLEEVNQITVDEYLDLYRIKKAI
jgi:tRNA A37 threonylcarbamoyladenosine synthetase subunit TsaC/SUA5/YrdC